MENQSNVSQGLKVIKAIAYAVLFCAAFWALKDFASGVIEGWNGN